MSMSFNTPQASSTTRATAQKIEQIEKIDKYIEIVGSSNPRLNAMTSGSRSTIFEVLDKLYSNVRITIVSDMADLNVLVAKKPDLVVLGMKLVLLEPAKGYDNSPKVWLSEYLSQHGIAHTGSETDALALEYNKQAAKQVVLDAGLHSAGYFVATAAHPAFDHTLRYPLFVKPTNRGNSKGIDEKSVVYNDADLRAKVAAIHNLYGSDALVEEYLPGREFSVAVVRQLESENLVAMPIEILAPIDTRGNSFLSQAVKRADSETVHQVSDPNLKLLLNTLAVSVFRALGSRDYGRIDMRLDSQGIPNFIEANLMPGLSNHGYLSRCFYYNAHITYDAMIASIVRLGLHRDAGAETSSDYQTLLAAAV